MSRSGNLSRESGASFPAFLKLDSPELELWLEHRGARGSLLAGVFELRTAERKREAALE